MRIWARTVRRRLTSAAAARVLTALLAQASSGLPLPTTNAAACAPHGSVFVQVWCLCAPTGLPQGRPLVLWMQPRLVRGQPRPRPHDSRQLRERRLRGRFRSRRRCNPSRRRYNPKLSLVPFCLTIILTRPPSIKPSREPPGAGHCDTFASDRRRHGCRRVSGSDSIGTAACR
jgi:hypothetical protein